ncbi:MAG TPA: hypothetical protein VHA12_04255 [Candidatus Nanoarchaeia archaeon]|nr:hypothetical protein [Candidatus Nanoarchaeia archaeon]
MNNKGFEFSFGWMFAIIVGAAIIAMAIYATTTFIDTQRKVEDSSKSLELSGLLRQLETGLEEQGKAEIKTNVKIRISNDCTIEGDTVSAKAFGTQVLKTSVSSGIGKEEWSDGGVPLKSQSIYLFSNKTIEGKEFVTLTKRFEFPYKVADMVMIWPSSTKYCFVNSPVNVKNEIEPLNIGINFSSSSSRCPSGSIKVCFAQTGCNIDVSQTTNTATKNGKVMYYDEIGSALFYGAIFSDPQVYECQTQRLAKKAKILGELYSEKSSYGAALGCSAESIQQSLDLLTSQLGNVRSSRELVQAIEIKKELGRANDALICPVF